MILFVLAYLGGVLTIVSPCILPVLPFVFARAGQPFMRSTLPMLAGMATAGPVLTASAFAISALAAAKAVELAGRMAWQLVGGPVAGGSGTPAVPGRPRWHSPVGVTGRARRRARPARRPPPRPAGPASGRRRDRHPHPTPPAPGRPAPCTPPPAPATSWCAAYASWANAPPHASTNAGEHYATSP